ncbi:MAG: hypothetical protein ABIO72_03745 [Patescibacteria group bacterium]
MTQDTLSLTANSKAIRNLKKDVATLVHGHVWVPIIVDDKDLREMSSLIRMVRDGINPNLAIQVFGEDGKASWDLGRNEKKLEQARKEPHCTLVLSGHKVVTEVWQKLDSIPFPLCSAMVITVPNMNQYHKMVGTMPPDCAQHARQHISWPRFSDRKADFMGIMDAIWHSIKPDTSSTRQPGLSPETRHWILKHMDQYKYVDDLYVAMRKALKFAIDVSSDWVHPIHMQADRERGKSVDRERKKARQSAREHSRSVPTANEAQARSLTT